MKRSWWRRLVDRLTGRRADDRPVPPEPSGLTPMSESKYRSTEHQNPITVLARGDVYEFRVYADLEWSSSAMSYADLTAQAAEYTGAAHDELRRRVWRIGRKHGPYHSAQAEKEMRELAADWCYDTALGRVRCVADLRVMPDERVREHLVPYAQREIAMDAEAALGNQKAEMVRVLLSRWHTVLSEVGVSPISVAAARLSDAGFAAVLERLSAERRDRDLDLVGVLRQASMDHEQLGMFEYAEMYAAAVASFLAQLTEEDRDFVKGLLNTDPVGGRP
jgi:hypothetical protein